MKEMQGGIIVAGENFGCGSSCEHAPIAIRYAEISCVIAKSFARIYFINCINIGLLIVELKKVDNIDENDIFSIDFKNGVVINISKKRIIKLHRSLNFCKIL